MTKSIKTLAVLGVLAGLGIAALPLNAQAETVTWGAEGLTDGTEYGTTDGKRWVKSSNEVFLNIEDALSIENNAPEGGVQLKQAAGASTVAGLYTGDAFTVNVKTNNVYGYDLTLAGTAEDNATSLTSAQGEQIVAGDLTGTVSQWGYFVGDAAADSQTWTPVKAAANADTIKSSSSATLEDGEDTKVTFGANIVDGQSAGKYVGTVTFTATNKPKPSDAGA